MDDSKIIQLTEKFIAENKNAIMEDIKALVKHPSIEAERTGDNEPFGKNVRAALDEALSIAAKCGLETGECDGYVGWAELKGKEKGHIATIAHLDVVPEGGGWDADPFTVREQGGWLLGRGVADNKGPAVLSIYTAKFFKENNIDLRYGLKVLLGTNEETGMKDVDYYLERNEEPLFCYSPDSAFPLCYGEKGVYSGNFTSAKIQNGIIENFNGGIASNVVPEHASCFVKVTEEKAKSILESKIPEDISVKAENGGICIDAKGIGGHAAEPQGTKSAILVLAGFLLDNELYSKEEKPFLEMQVKLFETTDGKGAGIDCSDDIFTPLTCIGGMVRTEDGKFVQNINVRYPTVITGEGITGKLKNYAAGFGCEYDVANDAAPYYIPKDSPPIKVLLSAFKEVFKVEKEPYTMGGGTYSRHFKNACAFGPELWREQPDFVGSAHAANEGISVEGIYNALRTYILAIWRLQEVDFQEQK